jgi:hypothetical protein
MAFLKKGKWLLAGAGIVTIATLICCFNIYFMNYVFEQSKYRK